MSEGQLRGYFSDGEVLWSTPRSNSRCTLEDGEIPPSPLRSPLPDQMGKKSVINTAGSVRGQGGGRRGDPRQHLSLLMSAHPHLKANRPSVHGLRKHHAHDYSLSQGRGEAEVYGGWAPADGQQRSDPRRGQSAGIAGHTDDGSSRAWRLRPREPTAKLKYPIEASPLENGVDYGGNGSSPSDSDQSLEPGQARAGVRRSWRKSDAFTSDRGGGIYGVGAGAGRIELGPTWLRTRVGASEGSSSSVGEASSGAEAGETLAVFLDKSIDGLSTPVGRKGEESGGTDAPHTRPLMALKGDAGASRRWVWTSVLISKNVTVPGPFAHTAGQVQNHPRGNREEVILPERNTFVGERGQYQAKKGSTAFTKISLGQSIGNTRHDSSATRSTPHDR